jgi:beta-phosphoglucomutase-like phosphatase (HAD superfamily)
VVLEDAIAGVEAARRGGMKCLAVTTTRLKEDLSGAALVEADLSGVNYETLRELLVD